MRHVVTGCNNPRHVALTFDDGIGQHTERLLDILKINRVKVTFFVLGNTLAPDTDDADQHRRLLLRMIKEGHVVASHSWSHPDLTQLDAETVRSQMTRADDAIRDILGVRTRFMRPPYGYLDQRTVKVLRAQGYIIVNWNQDTNDWKHQDAYREIISFVETSIPKPRRDAQGPIVLQHDTLKSAIKLQDRIIKILRRKGYEFVTMYECTGHQPYRL